MKIVLAIFILCIIIIAHEFGHFIIARANGIEVKEFFVGIGPTLWSKEKNGTLFSLKLIPFGGACIFMDADDLDNIENCSYLKSSVYARMATIIAGPVFNFILAFVFSLFVIGATGFATTKIIEVSENMPAYAAGLKAGDEIVKINGSKTYFYGEITFETLFNTGEPIDLVIRRDGELIETSITPKFDDEYQRMMLGITFGDYVENPKPLTTILYSFYNVRYWIKIAVKSVLMLFKGVVPVTELSGPVGVTQAFAEAYDTAAPLGIMAIVYSMLDMAILISANLGVMNLLPFPAIDGGKLIFLIIEAVTKKPVNRSVEGVINFAGMALLALLAIFVMYNDIVRIFTF